MDLARTRRTASDDDLSVDGFGLSIGPVSVGLPPACTPDDILGRYLDLVGLLPSPGGAGSFYEPPQGDIEALAAATAMGPERVSRRLAVLQTERAAAAAAKRPSS